MIHCLTSSYKRDFERASSLNNRLTNNGVLHHIFVESADLELFKTLESEKTMIHLKPDGGEGGLGRDGTMVRFECYKVMQGFVSSTDTYAQLDSDVIIDEEVIPELECSENEVKGFFNPKYPVHLERPKDVTPTSLRFSHCSGMTICAGGEVFNRSIPADRQEMLSIIDLLLNEGFTPSEDIVLSYLLQRENFKLTNLEGAHYRVFHPNGDIEIHPISKLEYEPLERRDLIPIVTL